MGLKQYGISVITISDYVERFSLQQGNVKNTYFIKNLVHAQNIWKDLFRTTIWQIKSVALKVHPHKHTIQLPDDVERLIAISVIDCHGKKHPLGFNPDYNTVEIKCSHNQCSCGNCNGEDTLCGALDNITLTTSTVDILGNPYTVYTEVRNNGNGDIIQATKVPVWDTSTGTVIYDVQTKVLCNVQVDEKGCILPIDANINALNEFCGCSNWSETGHKHGIGYRPGCNELLPPVYNYYGEFNWNAANRQIIHIFRHKHHRNEPIQINGQSYENFENDIEQVIVDYQTNGEENSCQQLLIPEYANEAMDSGMLWKQSQFSPQKRELDMLFNHYRRDKMNLYKWLNPIKMETVRKIQTNKRLW